MAGDDPDERAGAGAGHRALPELADGRTAEGDVTRNRREKDVGHERRFERERAAARARPQPGGDGDGGDESDDGRAVGGDPVECRCPDVIVADGAGADEDDDAGGDHRQVRLVELLEDVDVGEPPAAAGAGQVGQHGGIGAHGQVKVRHSRPQSVAPVQSPWPTTVSTRICAPELVGAV